MKQSAMDIISKDAKFLAKVKPNLETGCIEWQGSKRDGGYGKLKRRTLFGNLNLAAHRFVFFLKDGLLPPEHLQVCHSRDNPPCVNPDHLFLGTASDNMQDMHTKKRRTAPPQKGALNFNCKLTPDNVRFIHSKIAEGLNNKQIAAALGDIVTHSTISNIRRGKQWKLSDLPPISGLTATSVTGHTA